MIPYIIWITILAPFLDGPSFKVTAILSAVLWYMRATPE
jgi:hypothetical protein